MHPDQESQLLLAVPVRALGKLLLGCASAPLTPYTRGTCQWKGLNVFTVLDKPLSVLRWEQ